LAKGEYDKMNDEEVKKLVESHVDWYLSAIRPQLIDHMIHGYKHGYEDCKKENKE